MIITNENYEIVLKALEDDHIPFNSNDILEFHVNGDVLKYHSCINYLGCFNGNNDRIFRALGIADKFAFCEAVYGHKPRDGWFPEARGCYDECMVKIARALFDLCVGKSVSVETVSIIELKNSSILNGLQDDLDIKPKHLDWLDIPF